MVFCSWFDPLFLVLLSPLCYDEKKMKGDAFMISYKIDNSLIYEILNFIANSPNMTTTLREIVDNTSLTDYNSGNTAISEISKMGLLAGRANGDVITVTLDARGCGKLFLDNYKYVSRLTAKEKRKEWIGGFVSGVLVSVVAAVILHFLGI